MRSAAYSALRNNASFVSTLQSEGLKRTNKDHPMSCLFIDRHTFSMYHYLFEYLLDLPINIGIRSSVEYKTADSAERWCSTLHNACSAVEECRGSKTVCRSVQR